MSDLQMRLGELLERARSSVSLVIRKDGGGQESFEPETLLYSLFEAELPLTHMFDVFERVLERLSAFNELGEVTERQLHGLVTTVISGHDNEDAPVWLSNYHDIFYIDSSALDEVEDPEISADALETDTVVKARSASTVRRLIRHHLSRQLEADSAELSDLVDAQDVRDAANRVVKFIRFAGLRHARLSTLWRLVEDLSTGSQKEFLHRQIHSRAELDVEVARAERALETAYHLSMNSPLQARTEYRIALESVGRIFLCGCRLLSRPGRQHSFQYARTLLIGLHDQHRGQPREDPLPRVVTQRAEAALERVAKDVTFLVKTLRDGVDVLQCGLERGFADHFSDVRQAFEVLLHTARDMHGIATGRGALRVALGSSGEERSERVASIVEAFLKTELNLDVERVECGSGLTLRVQDLVRLRVRSQCLSYGRHCLMLFRFGEESRPLSRAGVQDFLYEAVIERNAFGVIFSDAAQLDKPLRDELKRLAMSDPRSVVVWMDVNALGRAISQPDAFLPSIDDSMHRALPALVNVLAQQARPEDVEMIPAEIAGYLRDYLSVLNGMEAARNWSGVKGEILPLLEEVACDYKFYLRRRMLQSLPSAADRQRFESTTEESLLGSDLNHSTQFSEGCLRLLPSRSPRGLRAEVVAFMRFIDRVRGHRNLMAHDYPAASEIALALHDVISAIRDLCKHVRYPDLYLCMERRGELIAEPLFGAAAERTVPGFGRAGMVLAVWSAGTRRELAMPKKRKPSRGAVEVGDLVVGLDQTGLTGDLQSKRRLSAVLARQLTECVRRGRTAALERRARDSPNETELIALWLESFTRSGGAASIHPSVLEDLGGYTEELAVAAVEEAVQVASEFLNVQVNVGVERESRLEVAGETGGRVSISVRSEERLGESRWAAKEIERWREAEEGYDHHFLMIFGLPGSSANETRLLKSELLRSTAEGRTFFSPHHLLEPAHSHFLLQRTGLENPADPDPERSVTAPRERQALGRRYDVFLCYNTEDRTEVRSIADMLRNLNLEPWFDRDQLRPGLPWQRRLEEEIGVIGAAAVFVGNEGVSPWQREESDAFLRQFVERGCPVIPVILQSVTKRKPRLPPFLANRMWVDFRSNDPDPLTQLVFGITGRRPQAG